MWGRGRGKGCESLRKGSKLAMDLDWEWMEDDMWEGAKGIFSFVR